MITGGSGRLCLACFPPAASDTKTPRQVRGLGSSRAIAALSAHGQPSCPPPWCSTHHTAHRYCRRSHCHHHSATGSGCSSHSGRGTRPPHTPGGLRAESSQAAAGSGGHYLEAQQKASQTGAVRHLQGCPEGPEAGGCASLTKRGDKRTELKTHEPTWAWDVTF